MTLGRVLTIYHETQYGNLCALHAINNLLQNTVFTARELAAIGRRLDNYETSLIEETSSDDDNTSENLDDTGNFSIQVISYALSLCHLELIPFNSSDPRAVSARQCTFNQQAFICHKNSHWFSVRKFHKRWFNLDSLLDKPERLADNGIHVSLFETQEDIDEFTGLFIVVGDLPEARTDSAVDVGSVSHLTISEHYDMRGSGKQRRNSDNSDTGHETKQLLQFSRYH